MLCECGRPMALKKFFSKKKQAYWLYYCNYCEKHKTYFNENWNYILGFGKYKDTTLQEIFEKDSQYIIWLYKELMKKPSKRKKLILYLSETLKHNGIVNLN